MLTIRWGYMPPEVRDAFRPVLLQYLWLVPGWCRRVTVSYSQLHGSGDPHSDASCGALPEYRSGSIQLHSGFLDCNPAQRRLSVVHEMLHLPTAPMVQEHEDLVDRLLPDEENPKFRAHVQEQWRQRFEGTVQDLAYAVLMIPESGLPPVQYHEEEDEHPEAADIRLRKAG